jgi:glycosyltransferase involved in cell wall biosynthesis
MLSGTRPRILVFAYACEPGRGSEPGAGWGLVRALAEFADCTVLVGPEHIAPLRAWRAATASEGLEFVPVDEPGWAPREPRHRFTRFAIYLAWLRRARDEGARLHRQYPFNAVYHATYSAYWLPTPATTFGVPCIWGPVGGAVVTPVRLWPLLGWRGVLTELVDLMAVRAFGAVSATLRSRQPIAVLVQNAETRARLPHDARERAIVLNHAMFTELPAIEAARRGSECLFVGALESRKGARLVLHALATTEAHVSLVVVGDGPERVALERLAARLGVAARVRFVGSKPRHDVLRFVCRAPAVVFTGLREEGGLALAEAMLAGAPVVVLAHGGARTIASASRDATRVILVEPGGFSDTARQIGVAMSHFTSVVDSRIDPTLDVVSARQVLRSVVERACA